MPSRKEILKYLYGLEAHGIKPGLGRIKRLLRALGDPQKGFHSIHVAGTNGKGSTCAFLFSVLREAGFPTGLYTSPHLERFNERIRTSTGLISDKDVVRTALRVKEAADETGQKASFFEFTTAMAFEYFRMRGVEMAVVETGMGGRWDATNVLSPLVSVITTVGLDHMEYLGDDITSIAREKAGIIKKGAPLITGVAKGPALKVLMAKAKEKRSSVFLSGRDFAFTRGPGGLFDYAGASMALEGLSIGLIGGHQHSNAACALAALEAIGEMGYRITGPSIRRGLKEAQWPGRVEVVGRRPLIVLDAAHNPDGARSLGEALKTFGWRRLIIVLGIMSDKDVEGILKPLAPLSDVVMVAAPATPRAASAETLVDLLKRHKRPARPYPSVAAACRAALKEAKRDDAICVTGSIYTVGEARKCLRALKSS